MKPPLAIGRHGDGRIAGHELPVPELAGHLLVPLIEPLAIVGELAAPHEVTEAQPDLPEPVGVGETLARGAHEVGLATAQDALGLLEGVDAAAGDDRGVGADLTYGPADGGGQRDVATEGPALVGEHRGHALVARLSRVRIDRLADFGLFGVLEAPALGNREVVHSRFGEARSEPRGIVQATSSGDDVVTEVADPDDR